MAPFSVFSNPICPSGSEFKLMVSGLSKFARRKNIELSNYCAFDLYLAGFQKVNNDVERKTRENYRSRFINRFPVAILEDNMPKFKWVLKYIKEFTEKTKKSYSEDKISIEVLKLINFLISNVASSPKCRSFQHLREVGDENFRLIESDPKKFRKIIGHCEDQVVKDCEEVFKSQKKPIILSAAYAYLKYAGICFEPKRYSLYFFFNQYVNGPRPKWEEYPYLFDKHVSASIAKKYGVIPVKGWKGFVENEEQVCWDQTPEDVKCDPFFVDLKDKYWKKRLSQ